MSDFENESPSTPNTGNVEPDLLDNQSFDEDVNHQSEIQANEQGEEAQVVQDEFTEPQSAPSDNGNVPAIAEWREKREAEIAAKDEADLEAKKRLQDEAVKHIDDFYENYNRKKSQQLETVKRESEEFLQKKNDFFSQENTTTWDRALQLINEDDADLLGGRDRSKFKEILQRLRGNPNAPGA